MRLCLSRRGPAVDEFVVRGSLVLPQTSAKRNTTGSMSLIRKNLILRYFPTLLAICLLKNWPAGTNGERLRAPVRIRLPYKKADQNNR